MMREFEYKRKIRRIFSSPIVLLVLAVVLLLLIRGVWGIYLKDRGAVADLGVTQERLERIKERSTGLSNAIQKLSTDTGVEAEIRDRFDLAKNGESAFVIVETADTLEPVASSSPTFLQKIWNFFTIR